MEFPVKYQVFISSTFRDLKDWRQAIIDKVLAAGHIPSGMEDFPAGNEEDLEVIKRFIDDCDVYVVIIGSKFGSKVRGKEKSFTQLEFEYARKKGKPILAFLQDTDEFFRERDALTAEDVESERHGLLKQFRDDVKLIQEDKNRLVGYFEKKKGVDALASRFGTALSHLVSSRSFNASGWVKLPFNVATNTFTKQILEGISDFETLSERCTQAAPLQKQAMAEHFWYMFRASIVHANIRDLFFESGSTIAYVASEFRGYLSTPAGHVTRNAWRLSTNNMITYLEFVLHEHIQIDLSPHGPPENKYGATFGSLTRFEDQRRPIENKRLRETDPLAYEAVLKLAKDIVPQKDPSKSSDGKKRQPALILASASGLELESESDFIGPHVGSYYNKLFKRALLESGHPIVLFLDESKISSDEKGKFQVGDCHAVCDEDLSWEHVCANVPLALCVGADSLDRIEACEKQLEKSGFAAKEFPRKYQTGWAIILENKLFGSRFGKKTKRN